MGFHKTQPLRIQAAIDVTLRKLKKQLFYVISFRQLNGKKKSLLFICNAFIVYEE